MNKFRIMIMSAVISGKLFAQQPSVSNWVTVQMPVIYNNHWQSLHELSYRTLGEAIKLNQLFVRSGVRYTFNPQWTSSLICDFVHSRVKPFDKSDLEFGDEIRITEEVSHRYPLGKAYTIQHRLRIEERFFGETSLGDDYTALRFRYRLAAQKKLSDKWSLQLADEYLEQALSGRWSYNSNRLSFSGFYSFAQNAHLEAIYYWIRFSERSQHVFALTLQNRILVKSKKKMHGS